MDGRGYQMVSVAHSISESAKVNSFARLRTMLPLGRAHFEADEHQSLARPGSTNRNIPFVEQIAEFSDHPIALYIDKYRLGRDCVSEQLASQLPRWAIEPLASIRELEIGRDWHRKSIAILQVHSASLGTAEAASEIAMIAEVAPGIPFVVMSDLEDPNEVLLAMQLGARGYLPASLPLSQAMIAIRFVAEGGTYIPTCILTTWPVAQRTPPARPVDRDRNPIAFSPRQLQVLERLRQGKQNKTIAYELDMCESTVKVHIRAIMKKLNARNRTQVVLLTNGTDCARGAELAA
jgi:DNA-binding NarL/FixJ family response regulator